ncbi:MAG TPA: 2-C-methyl-D-erythritol 2,4-cyclodiphosphate synthase [Actinomycetota bacterium]|jgi:2-C-methyl-D-erythritol 2,4-cyclodiphosphate synthase
MSDVRIGLGFDVHRRADDRPLYLGGVEFGGESGLLGHSDGDVICHALGDALLGAAALGDLGDHFPDTDPAFAGIAGLDLLGRVVALLEQGGFAPTSCDVTFVAERPHIAGHRDAIRGNLATTLAIPVDRVSVKATRPEGLGLSGDGAGCLAAAVIVHL